MRSWLIGNLPRATGVRSRAGPGACLLLVVVLLGASLGITGATALGEESNRLIAPRDECPEQNAVNASEQAQFEAMHCLVDYARDNFGVPPLADAPELDWSAEAKARDILDCDSFSHSACGREFTFWMKESGYLASRCWRAGENLASGVGVDGTARSVFIALMRSPAHRRNILGRFDRLGLGLRIGHLEGRGRAHVWVQHFGTHCSNSRTRRG